MVGYFRFVAEAQISQCGCQLVTQRVVPGVNASFVAAQGVVAEDIHGVAAAITRHRRGGEWEAQLETEKKLPFAGTDSNRILSVCIG